MPEAPRAGGGGADDVLNERLRKQTRNMTSGSVEWGGRRVTVAISQKEGDMCTARVLDPALPLDELPTVRMPLRDLRRMTYDRHATVDELVDALRDNGTLQSPRVADVLRSVDRRCFADEHPYNDAAIDIGCGVCISAPHMHAYCLEFSLPALQGATRVLDVGSGSGYLAAALAHLAPNAHVYGIDFHAELARKAAATVQRHLPKQAARITFVSGDGEQGYAPGAPFDVITVGFMCRGVPQKLVDQLKPGGRLIAPVGQGRKSNYDARLDVGDLMVVEKAADGSVHPHSLFICSYLPSLAGQAAKL